MKTFTSRRRNIGLAAGALWLIAISFVFIIWSLIAIGTLTAKIILIGIVILLCILVAAGIIVLRASLNLPDGNAPRTPEEQKIGRRFAFVAGAEVLAFSLVNPIIGVTGHYELMPSVNLIIVGIHFFPLAQIFRVPRYHLTGLLFCLIPMATLIAIPQQFTIGHTLAWYVVPSFGCGLVACITALAGFSEAWKSIPKIRGAV